MTLYTGSVKMSDFLDKILEHAKLEGWTVRKDSGVSVVPVMTSDTAPAPFVASASSVHSVTYYPAFKAFNGITTGAYDRWVTAQGTVTGWLKIDLGSARVVTKYSLTSGYDQPSVDGMPSDFTIEGSNDDVNWAVIDTKVGIKFTAINQEKDFYMSNATGYRYYRINITKNGGYTGWTSIGEMRLFEATHSSGGYRALLTSTGSSATDNIAVELSSGSSKDSVGNNLGINFAEKYENGHTHNADLWRSYYFGNNTALNINPTSILLTYYADITKDRIFFATILDPSANHYATNACYLGLMKRYSSGDSTANVMAYGMQAPTVNPRVIKNKAGSLHQDIIPRWVGMGYSPSVWGDNVFVSPIFLEGNYEGVRGELDGIFTCRAENMVNEDEILVGTVKYKVIYITAYGNNSFPQSVILVKLPTA